jgi:hypothetical protein
MSYQISVDPCDETHMEMNFVVLLSSFVSNPFRYFVGLIPAFAEITSRPNVGLNPSTPMLLKLDNNTLEHKYRKEKCRSSIGC